MFCNKCGTENSGENIYCTKDGVKLKTGKSYYSMLKERKKFCPSCGAVALEEDNYCSSCGGMNFKLTDSGSDSLNLDKVKNIKLPKDMEGFKTIFSRGSLLGKFIYGGIGFVTVLLISVFLKIFINEVLKASISNIFDGYFDLAYGFGELVDYFGSVRMSDMMSLLNGSAFNVKSFDVLSGKVQLGLMFFIGLPMIVFNILGFIKAFVDKEDRTIVNILTNSLLYCILIGFISVLSYRKIDIGIETLSLKVGFISTVFNGFVISFLGMLLGYSIGGKIKKISFTNPIEEGIFNAGFLFSIVYISIGLIVTVYMFNNFDIEEILPSLAIIISYLFLGANLGSVSLTGSIAREITGNMYTRVSLINNKGFLEGMESSVSIILILAVLIPIAVFFIKGLRDKKANTIKELCILPGIYGLLLVVFASPLKIVVSSAKASPNIFTIFIGGVIISGLPYLAGKLIGGGFENEAK